MVTCFRIVCAVLAALCMVAAVDSFTADNHSQALVLGCIALLFNGAWTYHIFQETNR